jgi:hypothetical protein
MFSSCLLFFFVVFISTNQTSALKVAWFFLITHQSRTLWCSLSNIYFVDIRKPYPKSLKKSPFACNLFGVFCKMFDLELAPLLVTVAWSRSQFRPTFRGYATWRARHTFSFLEFILERGGCGCKMELASQCEQGSQRLWLVAWAREDRVSRQGQ